MKKIASSPLVRSFKNHVGLLRGAIGATLLLIKSIA